MDLVGKHEAIYGRNLKLLMVFAFLRFAAFWQPVEQVYIYGIGGNELTVALAAFMWLLAQLLLEVPSGYFSDVFGRKNTFLLGQIARLLGYLFIIIPQTETMFIVGAFLFGVSFTLTSGADNAMLHETLQKLGKVDSYKKYSGRLKSLNVSGVLVGAVFAIPISLISFWANFAFSILPSIISLFVILQMHEPGGFKKRPITHAENAFSATKKVFRLIGKQHILLFWISLVALLEFIKRIGMDFGQAFLLDLTLASIIVTITWAAGSFGRLAGNELAHKYRGGLLPLVISSVGLLVALSFSPRYVAPFIYAAMFIPINMAIIINEEAIQKIAPAKLRATTLSSVNFLNQLIVAPSILALGFAITRTNAIDSFRNVSLIITACAAVILVSLKMYHAKRL